jgi:hypothetical protein
MFRKFVADVISSGRNYSLFVYSLPIVFIALMTVTYFIAPDFYLTYIISLNNRENQLLEILTFSFALISALLLWKNAWVLSKIEPFRLAACWLAVIGLASFFFAGEEISWGQSYFHWQTPELYTEVSRETNLHNGVIPVNMLGGLFINAAFILFPLAWKMGKLGKLNRLLAPVVPEGPVIFCIFVASAWRLFKSVYRSFISPEMLTASAFYVDFLEQLNEHKEFLVALGLLIYAVYKNSAIRSMK